MKKIHRGLLRKKKDYICEDGFDAGGGWIGMKER